MDKTAQITPIGVFSQRETVYLFFFEEGHDGLKISKGDNETDFKHLAESVEIEGLQDVQHSTLLSFNVSSLDEGYYGALKYQEAGKTSLYGASSDDLLHWRIIGKVDGLRARGVVVPNYKHEDSYVMYYGESSIGALFSKNFSRWKKAKDFVLRPQEDFYGKQTLLIGNAVAKESAPVLFYFVKKRHGGYALHLALFDKGAPQKLVRSPKLLWETPGEWITGGVRPLGVVLFHDHPISYWWVPEDGIFAITHPPLSRLIEQEEAFPPHLSLNKSHKNPIIKPTSRHWESRATFNPAAVYEAGKVHIVYRAIGDHDVSVLGYASSKDGIHIDERLPDPIYVPREDFETGGKHKSYHHHLSPFASGGGIYGGCEDPRLTKIDGRFYMTYVAYDGNNPPRVALTSIDEKDFLDHEWNWGKPVLISPPGRVDKNACILPEKIDNKYVVFHRIFPNILIDFVDSLEFDGETTFIHGEYKIPPRSGYWDSRKLGVGPPPIKTEAGWLVIYQAVDDRNASQYKIGAMLLDLADPTRVLHRTVRPILEPNAWYENEGHKSGVAYPCGAVVLDSQIIVYYGGADTVVCVAHAPIDEFLDHLTTTETADLYPIGITKTAHYD